MLVLVSIVWSDCCYFSIHLIRISSEVFSVTDDAPNVALRESFLRRLTWQTLDGGQNETKLETCRNTVQVTDRERYLYRDNKCFFVLGTGLYLWRAWLLLFAIWGDTFWLLPRDFTQYSTLHLPKMRSKRLLPTVWDLRFMLPSTRQQGTQQSRLNPILIPSQSQSVIPFTSQKLF